jgi:hypothetical protein
MVKQSTKQTVATKAGLVSKARRSTGCVAALDGADIPVRPCGTGTARSASEFIHRPATAVDPSRFVQ